MTGSGTGTGGAWIAAILGVLGASSPLLGQPVTRSGVTVTSGVEAGLWVGDASDSLDGGWGPWVAVGWRPSGGPVGWTVDGTWVVLEEDTDPFGGAAENATLLVLTGPTAVADWGPVRPRAGLVAGVAAGSWEARSGAGGEDGTGTAFAWGGTLGLAVTLVGGERRLSLRAGGRILDVGELDFARAPAPGGHPGTAGVSREDFGTVEVRLGLTLSL